MAIFNSELQNPNTKFFILDTGRIEHRDIDFEMYSWNKHRYNLMNPGDLTIIYTQVFDTLAVDAKVMS